jgi:hypothetical protein
MEYAGPLIVVTYFISSDVITLILLMSRYVIVERFRSESIIYLRSFAYEEAAEILGEAVVPAVSCFGVLKALVHHLQPEAALLSRTSIWQFGFIATAPDEYWRNWVTEALQSASLVIIDRSIATESIA